MALAHMTENGIYGIPEGILHLRHGEFGDKSFPRIFVCWVVAEKGYVSVAWRDCGDKFISDLKQPLLKKEGSIYI